MSLGNETPIAYKSKQEAFTPPHYENELLNNL